MCVFRLLLFNCFFLVGVLSFAQHKYESAKLADISQRLTRRTSSAVIPNVLNGKPIVVETDSLGTISHIGYKLFGREMILSPVCKFLERYLLELNLIGDGVDLRLKLKDDKVIFVNGNWTAVQRIDSTVLFTQNYVKDKYYEVAWYDKNNTELLRMAFPAQFELLYGMPKSEIEQKMQSLICSTPEQSYEIDLESLVKEKNGIYSSIPNQHYKIESLNNCVYFVQNFDGVYSAVFDSVHVLNSLQNLMQVPMQTDYPLVIDQGVYGMKHVQYSVKLSQWLNFCRYNQLTIYTAVEEEDDEAYKLLVIAENRPLAYNHLLSVIVPKNIFINKKSVLKAKISAYIPTHNIVDIYQKYVKRPKKKYETSN